MSWAPSQIVVTIWGEVDDSQGCARAKRMAMVYSSHPADKVEGREGGVWRRGIMWRAGIAAIYALGWLRGSNADLRTDGSSAIIRRAHNRRDSWPVGVSKHLP